MSKAHRPKTDSVGGLIPDERAVEYQKYAHPYPLEIALGLRDKQDV